MNPSRLAGLISLIYLLPLTLWLTAQLELSDWSAAQVQGYLQQAIYVVAACQCLGMALLQLDPAARALAADFSGLLLLLLFPLPLLTLSWLTGSLEIYSLLKLSGAPVLIGVLALGLHRGLILLVPSPHSRTPLLGLLQSGLLMLLWHYRELWLAWSGP